MDFDTNWDIEKYKSHFECEEHWELRKNFLIIHKDKYPEDQLVCLAQVFFNIELLGCKYPRETMDLVATLSEGIADSFRESKQQKIQRTFVQASDAAGARIKGQAQTQSKGLSSLTTASFVFNSMVKKENQINCIKDWTMDFKLQSKASAEQTDQITSVMVVDPSFSIFEEHFFDNIIIIKKSNENNFDHGSEILTRSFDKNKMKIECQFSSDTEQRDCKLITVIWTCRLLINSKEVALATGSKKKIAKNAAFEALLSLLLNICFLIEVKHEILSDGSTIGKTDSIPEVNDPPMLGHSIGSKMMKTMGWKGGGLGKLEQGLVKPIKIQSRIVRSGLGITGEGNFQLQQLMKILTKKLENFAQTDTKHDLVFSNDFSIKERAKLHSIAQRFNLKAKSMGRGDERHLIVSKKISNYRSIVQELISCGGENEKYRLVPPKIRRIDFTS